MRVRRLNMVTTGGTALCLPGAEAPERPNLPLGVADDTWQRQAPARTGQGTANVPSKETWAASVHVKTTQSDYPPASEPLAKWMTFKSVPQTEDLLLLTRSPALDKVRLWTREQGFKHRKSREHEVACFY